MSGQRPIEPPLWALFVVPLVIAVAIITGFLVAGPVLGFAAAVIVAALIVMGAVRPRISGEAARQAGRRFLFPVAIAVVGVVVVALGSGVVRIVGWGVIAVAVTVAMSLVFLEVGYSEDRARARERNRGARPRRRDEP